ncbi:MAG: hypothetical protein AAGI07_20435, partial [Bacteroidota bacterium]
MIKNEEEKSTEMYRLRKSIGLLGVFLPIALYLGYDPSIILNSFSHYYYTRSSVFFIAVIFTFALLLFSYKGYEKLPEEKVSDNFITTLAGIFALLTVLIPTSSAGSGGVIPFAEAPYLFGHSDNKILSSIHLISAGIFISLLGFMSYFKFTLSEDNTNSLNTFYKISALCVWGSIICIILCIIIEDIGIEIKFPYIFIFEFI